MHISSPTGKTHKQIHIAFGSDALFHLSPSIVGTHKLERTALWFARFPTNAFFSLEPRLHSCSSEAQLVYFLPKA